MRIPFAFSIVCLTAATLSASSGPDVPISERAKGAKKVMVATVLDVQSTYDVNDFGDRLIVSHALLRVDETMKGTPESSTTVTVEGGTVGETSLSVSDMPVLAAGDRAVLFLDDSNRGGHVPHGRGLGVLKLDGTNHVEGSALTIAEIRSIVNAAKGKE
jgi:hypothetical protein